jgi:hypothetical protein
MKKHAYHNWTRLTASGIAVYGPCVVSHISGDGSSAGKVATVYDGGDDSGGEFCTLEAAANQHQPLTFYPPVIFDHGVYVKFESAGQEVVIAYRQVSDAELKAMEE